MIFTQSYAIIHKPEKTKTLQQFCTSLYDDSTIPPVCYGCEMGKSTCDSFSATVRPKKTTRTFEIVHSDLCGPMQSNSIQGSSYYASFIDDFSSHSLVYFLKQKSQFAQAFKLFLAWGETQSGQKLKALHSDRGGEYIGKDTQDILKQKGIEHHLMMPGSAQQNGKAKQFNCTIMDKALAMQHTAGLSYGFWEFAVESAVHIQWLKKVSQCLDICERMTWHKSGKLYNNL